MSKDKWKDATVAYAGKRYTHKKTLVDCYYIANGKGEVIDDEEMLYKSATGRGYRPIGCIIRTSMTDNRAMDFNVHEVTAKKVSKELIEQWSAESAVAKRARENENARKKMTEEHRTAWLDRLEPLRRQYWKLTAAQRRAMQQLLIEWLNKPPSY